MRAGKHPNGSCGIVVSQALGDMEEGNPECEAWENFYTDRDTLKDL